MDMRVAQPKQRAGSPALSEPELERARGSLGLVVAASGEDQHIVDLRQSGCGRLLFPAIPVREPLEAVVVNTAGGLTGGDRFDLTVRLKKNAKAVVTTQACEKIYRSSGKPALLSSKIHLEDTANLLWLPQETILFDHSSLNRSLSVDMTGNARLLAAEAVILGRQAMGEVLTEARFADRWRIRRDGKLVFAEDMMMQADWAKGFQAKAALGTSTAALATIALVAPDAEKQLQLARDLLNQPECEGGASAFDGMLIIRLLASSGLALRQSLVPILELLSGQRLPRVWMT
ncbi:MAG: urease accessory protein UreD [Beijerinckiaceae bacterium]